MCGRTCLTLEPRQILTACKYKRRRETHNNFNTIKIENDKTGCNDDDTEQPEWRHEYNCGQKYIPSFNLAPTDITPVLVSHKHFIDNNTECSSNKWIVVPMKWGMIPYWHKGDIKKHRLNTNNCRLESMKESKLYGQAFKKGQRCVILCEGFYEWQTTTNVASSSNRSVYFIYMPQKDNVKIYEHKTWNAENISLLKMAGLFDIWEDANGDKMYSYSIITRESTDIMSWLHHRMPVILETEQEVDEWLDFEKIPDLDVMKVSSYLPTKLHWHQVSNIVNNSRNKIEQCNKPIEMTQASKSQMNTTMMKWLNTGVKRKRENINAKNLPESPTIKKCRF